MSYKEYDENGNFIIRPDEYIFSRRGDYLAFFEIQRKKMKISLEGIGKVIGVNKPTASKIFRGKLGLSTDKLIKLLDFFGYQLIVSELIADEDYGMTMTVEEYQKDLEREELQDEIKDEYSEKNEK